VNIPAKPCLDLISKIKSYKLEKVKGEVNVRAAVVA